MNNVELIVSLSTYTDSHPDSFALILSDVLSCKIEETLNGDYILILEYPKNGKYIDRIYQFSGGNNATKPNEFYIRCPVNIKGDLDYFRIYAIDSIKDNSVIVYARQMAIDYAIRNTLVPLSFSGNLSDLLSNYFSYGNYVFSADFDKTINFISNVPTSKRSLMGGQEGSIIDVVGYGEWKYDKYNCTLLQERGSDKSHNIQIMYGKNLISLKKNETIDNMCASIYPYYYSTDQNGDPVYVSCGYVRVSNVWSAKVYYLDLTTSFDTVPTQTELRNAATNFISNNLKSLSVSKTRYTCQFVLTRDLYDLELGDTINVLDKYKESVNFRVLKTEWDVLLNRYSSIEIGNKLSSSLSENINQSVNNDFTQIEITKLKTDVKNSKERISELETSLSSLSFFQVKTYSYTFNISASASLNITGANLRVSTPNGYTPIGIQRIVLANANVAVRHFSCKATGSTTMVALRNLSSSQISSTTITVDILYAKSSTIST